MKKKYLSEILEKYYNEFNNIKFIDNDPIKIPHQYKLKQDIEIAAFLTSTISWGNRKSIINNAQKLMNLMDNSPFQFISQSKKKDLQKFNKFVHRTFNNLDCIYFIMAIKHIYKHYNSIENLFYQIFFQYNNNIEMAIHHFHQFFFSLPHDKHAEKHLPTPLKGSACKKFNMFLRWMVRKDNRGVDFGIWNNIPPNKLVCPLDVHSANTARKLKLISRKQNDWKAAIELTNNLMNFDPLDPVRFDFALFGISITKNIIH